MYQKYIPLLLIAFLAYLPVSVEAQNRVRAYNRNSIPSPPGMVYVPGGSIVIKYNTQNGDSTGYKQVSLSPFFIDQAEVTNKQYREFVNWVIDSIAITNYLNDDKYFTDRNRDSIYKYINWDKINNNKPIWRSSKADIQNKLQPMFAQGDINRDKVNYTYTRLKRGTKGRPDEYVTETVNIYPDTKVWATDFPNSQNEIMTRAYFSSEAYDDYPVIGVTWKQAMAYSIWRTNTTDNRQASKYLMSYNLPYTLPSEAQWVYAAQGEISYESIDSFRIPRDKKGRLEANFKQGEGSYTQDGSSYTMHVMSYSPNEFGLHNMYGNVAEWVLDAYNESAWAFVHDQNPVLLYEASEDEPDIMKRKVVRGGSWKDNAQSLSPYNRNFEVQDVPHSYIGFRCVMPAPEILTKKVESR